MQNLDRVFARLVKSGAIPQRRTLNEYRFRTIGKNYPLSSLQDLPNQAVDFSAGTIILSLGAWASVNGVAGNTVRGDLSMVRCAINYPSMDGSLIAGASVNLASILGLRNDRLWPEKEIVIPDNGTLNVSLKNLTTSLLDVDMAWNCLIFRGASA